MSESLVVRFADRYGVEHTKLLETLKNTAFKQQGDKEVSNAQMMALLIVAEQHKLNPFTREIFAFDDKRGGIVPVVSVDGWFRIINEHPQLDGLEFEFDESRGAMTCILHRKDRAHPTRITEYMAECRRPGAGPWQSHPLRMLRHKALIQCARAAFGFAGIYDEDEGDRVLTATAPRGADPGGASASASRAAAAMGGEVVAEAVEVVEPSVAEAQARYAQEIEGAASASDAELILEEARGVLPAQQVSELSQVYRTQWHPQGETQ